MHDHHVVPRSLGGTKTVPLCEDCHGLVHGRSLHTASLTKAALQAKRARGERAGGVPFGFSADAAGRLTPNVAEQEVIAVVRQRRASGVPFRAIEAELARAGLASRTGRPFGVTQVFRMAKAAA